MRYRNDNMLLRIAQGDAYALAAEYAKRKKDDPERDELLEMKRYLAHPTYHKLKPGTYTDDTQMSIAVAEVIIKDASGCYWENYMSAETFAQHFFEAFKRDERDGYSRGFQKVLEGAQSPDHLRQLIIPNSTKNGAAMRSVPLGVMYDPKEIVRIAGIQAAVTHATGEGIQSSVATALMSHYALYDRRGFSGLRAWGNRYCPVFEYFREPWVGPVKAPVKHSPFDVGVNTAWAVHTLLVEETSLKGIMRRILEWGGDTDSVAAIAWGIASCRMQDEELPEFLERDLEVGNTKYGVAYLKQLGKQLMDAYA